MAQGCLSKGGRLILLQSVLGSIPIYYLSLFKIPVKQATKLEQLMREFFWKGKGENNHGEHLVKWEVVSKLKIFGGLGVGNLVKRNMALLGKWLWRFSTEQNILWRSVIESIYGLNQNGWDSNMDRKCSLRAPWKSIVKGWQQFISNTEIKVGNGNKTRFWSDKWVGSCSFKEEFPRLFRISGNKNALVADVVRWAADSSPSWDFVFSRNLNDWEVEEFASMLGKIHSINIDRHSEDKRLWRNDPSNKFSCKLFFLSLCQDNSTAQFPLYKML